MKNILIILPFGALILGCSSIKTNYFSLLEYADKSKLDAYGLNQNTIDLIENSYNKLHGYNRYKGYEKTHLQNFDIITNPHNPNELYIAKDGKFILDIKESEVVNLYAKQTSFPNPQDVRVFWNPNIPSVFIASKETMYYDLGLNGSKIFFQKKPYQGRYMYQNYTDIASEIPRVNIIKATIDSKECEPLVSEIACCINSTDKKYYPYQFNYDTGWHLLDVNSKAYGYCNSKDLNSTRENLIKNIFN